MSTTDSVVGVALDGVPIMAGIAEISHDPFNPVKWDNKPIIRMDFDGCLGNNDYSDFYHYYSFSPCMLNTNIKASATGQACSVLNKCKTRQQDYALEQIPSHMRKATPIGIARDGHLIYGPFKSSDEVW